MGHTVGPPGQDDLPGDLEAVSSVEGDVALLGGLEIGADALAVAAVEDGREERGADALALMDGIGAEDGQIPVRGAGVLALDGRQHAQGSRDVEAEGGDHLGRAPQDLPEAQLPVAGGVPQRAAGPVGVGVATTVGEVLDGERDFEVLGDAPPARRLVGNQERS